MTIVGLLLCLLLGLVVDGLDLVLCRGRLVAAHLLVVALVD